MIEVRGLTKRFREGVGILGLDLDVAAGEVVALIGPNGAGKSTALRAIGGQILPDQGIVKIAGVDLLHEPLRAKAKMGFLPQEPALYPYLTGDEYLVFMSKVRGDPDIARALAICDLGPAARRLTREYSYGMQKRLAFAGAVMGAPAVVLLDEIFAGLDPVAAARFADHLRKERDRGAAVLLSGHELLTVAELADRVVALVAGRHVYTFARRELDELRKEPGGLDRAFASLARGDTARPGY